VTTSLICLKENPLTPPPPGIDGNLRNASLSGHLQFRWGQSSLGMICRKKVGKELGQAVCQQQQNGIGFGTFALTGRSCSDRVQSDRVLVESRFKRFVLRRNVLSRQYPRGERDMPRFERISSRCDSAGHRAGERCPQIHKGIVCMSIERCGDRRSVHRQAWRSPKGC